MKKLVLSLGLFTILLIETTYAGCCPTPTGLCCGGPCQRTCAGTQDEDEPTGERGINKLLEIIKEKEVVRSSNN